MNARDGANLPYPALFPVPGTTQSIVLAADTNAARTGSDFKADTIAIGVRVRGTGTAAIRLGDANVAATATDLSIAKEDLWLFLSIDGVDAASTRRASA